MLTGCDALWSRLTEHHLDGRPVNKVERPWKSGAEAGAPPRSLQETMVRSAMLGLHLPKLQVYIRCLNNVEERYSIQARMYEEWSGQHRGFSNAASGAPPVGFMQVDVDTNYCVTGLREAVARPPAMAALDASASKYADEMAHMMSLFASATQYYTQKEYLSDHYAKGRAMHAGLVAQTARFRQVSTQFRDTLERENRAARDQALQSIFQREGKSLRWHRMTFLASANQLVSDIHPPHIDAPLFERNLANLIQTHAGLEDAAKAAPAENASLSDRSHFADAKSEFLGAARELDVTLKAKGGIADAAKNLFKSQRELAERANALSNSSH